MNSQDFPRFTAAIERMCRLHGMPKPSPQTLADWSEVLKPYAIDVIEPALDKARADAGRFQVKAAAAEAVARALTRGAQAGSAHGTTRYIPVSTDEDGRTIYQAEYACPICEDGGWQPVRYDATGQTRVGEMTMGELRAAEAHGRVPYRMRRCACKVRGGAA